MTNRARATTHVSDRRAQEAFALRDLRTQLHRLGPQRVLLLLDLLALALVAGAYVQLAPPELLFHAVFVVLTVEAFVYGRSVCFTRIVASSVALLGYVALPALQAGVEPLDLTEWPLMFAIAILVAWMADRERTAVRRYARLYRSARDRLVTGQEEERRRLSRDLHDGIGQTLTALTLALDAATGDFSQPAANLDRARALATSALDEVRSAAERVRPPRLEARGLVSALHELALRCGAPVEVALDPGVPNDLPASYVLEVYRIAQEALGNTVRHAGAHQVLLAIERVHSGLRLEIADDGAGFRPNQVEGRGLGLTGMRERAALMGARLRIVSKPQAGTRVILHVPLPRSAATVTLKPMVGTIGPGGGQSR